jgi:peptide chain release factor subunit 1
MFTETSLRKIQDFSAVHPVVSLYLNTEPAMGNAETHRLRLRNMLKELPLEKDVESIEAFFGHKYDWSGRAVAVFSCAPANFFEYIPLAIPVKDYIKVGSKAEIEPLQDLLEDFNNLGVILVDQQGARLFHFHMGELMEQQGILGTEVKHVKSGSATSSHGLRGGSVGGDRSVKETIERNLREIRDFAMKFFETHRVKKIMIAGSDDNVSQFKASLTKQAQAMVVGTFAMSMTASHADVVNRILLMTKEIGK